MHSMTNSTGETTSSAQENLTMSDFVQDDKIVALAPNGTLQVIPNSAVAAQPQALQTVLMPTSSAAVNMKSL